MKSSQHVGGVCGLVVDVAAGHDDDSEDGGVSGLGLNVAAGRDDDSEG